MTMQFRTMERVFRYNGVRLPDPDPKLTPEEVRAAYTNQYPELATASITGPDGSGDQLRYDFVRAIGTKG
jgi:PRTRC genetic system protein C